MRVIVILSTAVLGVGLVAGCGSNGGGDSSGSSSTSGYCQDLKAAQSDFASLNSSTADPNQFSDAIATFHKLAGNAPPAVDQDWKTLDGAFSTLEKELKDAGISLKDLAAITQGKMPAGMTQADVAALGPKLEATFGKLDDAEFKKAGDNIEKQAKSVCHVDLSKS